MTLPLIVAIGLTACARGATVSFVEPSDGDMVSSPVRVVMEAQGLSIEPAGPVREGAGHLHLMIDTGCVGPGQNIPDDEAHVHLGDGATETDLRLAPGEHSLCLQAGNGQHVALDLTDEITITVVTDGVTAADGTVPAETRWAGTIFSENSLDHDTRVGATTCTAEWEGAFEVMVDAEGVVDGSGQAEATSGPDCEFPGQLPDEGVFEFQVTGTVDAEGFTLHWTFTTALPHDYAGFFPGLAGFDGEKSTEVPLVRPGVAETQFHSQDRLGPYFQVDADIQIVLACANC